MAGAAAIPRPLKRSRRCKHASFPLDLLPEVAARSDPATLVRCAATCKEIRRHIADPAFHGRLRLRHADRFVPSLLRGGLADTCDMSLRLVDRTTGDVTRLLSTAACFPPDADGWPVSNCQTVAARDGLILFGRVGWGLEDELCVCCPATGRRQVLPPGPRFRGQYALLVGDRGGDGVVGRPFQVLKACFVKPQGGWRSLHIHTFSSEQGAWSPRIVRSSRPLIMHGDEMLKGPGIVAGDTVHWLYHMNRTHYVLKLHLKAPRVTFTEFPKSFHRACSSLRDRWWAGHILLATSSSGRSPIALVANNGMIYAWAQSESTGKWSKRPQFIKDCGEIKVGQGRLWLEWFAERSGLVLVKELDSSNFLLDLQSKDIIKCSSSSSRIPYEMDVSSWVPTFTKFF